MSSASPTSRLHSDHEDVSDFYPRHPIPGLAEGLFVRLFAHDDALGNVKTDRDVTYRLSRRFEQLIQTISIPYKGLSEQE